MKVKPPGGGGGTPYNGIYGETLPKRGAFFRLHVNERVRIFLVEVYLRVGESVISIIRRPKWTNRCILWLWKS